MERKSLIICLCGSVALVLAACVADPDQVQYPLLPGSFPDRAADEPLVADEAYISDTDFWVRFQRGPETVYGGGNWAERIQLEGGPAGAPYGGPFLLPLQYQQPERWPEPPDERHAIRLLSIAEWKAFRDRFFEMLLPPEDGRGVVLNFNIDDYFLFYDEQGRFQSVPMLDKPGDYAVSRSLPFTEFMRLGLPLLEQYLDARGIAERRVAFNTGDTGDYSLPFLYVNLDIPVAVFVRLPPEGRQFRTGNKSIPIVQTAGHVAGSHTSAIVFRPISSVYRLLFVATDTVTETIQPDYLVTLEQTELPPVSAAAPMDLVDWERRLDALTGRGASQGSIHYLVDGEEFFTRFIDALSAARSSIHLRTYIFDNDDYATRFGEFLKRRSQEGVEVRVLLDGLGTIISTIEQQESLPEDYEGPSSVHKYLERDSKVDVRQAANPWLTGDHVKTATIDRSIAFTGGMNIAREYRYDWHDLMMELRGPVVGVLQEEFDKAWAHAGFLGDYTYLFRSFDHPAPEPEEQDYPVRVLFTRVDDPEIFMAQREAIRNARRYIYVENAYFTDDAMLYELARARRRGVDVRVIMPLVTDRGPITRNNALAANAMLAHGIRVFVYPGMSHVKAALFDGWACLGSANWDRLSFRINKELNIATSHPPAVRELEERLFERDFARSVEITEPFPERWSDYLIELVGDYVF
ncbi:MAG: phosphatidylserine/phosphatidylglycerophosphate/cardiolipin synthase family protein [Gammaproteobacteria bacterium]|nr:phosphatidylserine/phosphatidylglycerophosphate/cardiolipin synthase family protein [Gammaproteobacteria bacterium]MDH4254022.1 phosphatidylserine/phosphatidylglycerophosphate/cardiolipin synthase family protein [Gammaproteobacteria bacterium]MDH5310321.1 phosphatidylserine/phosphatidylglycerophosphate/cardiolipin synthase family protein [Gammaproteobacteria bacterium]